MVNDRSSRISRPVPSTARPPIHINNLDAILPRQTCRCGRVAKALLYDLGMQPGREELRRVSVAQIMEPHRREGFFEPAHDRSTCAYRWVWCLPGADAAVPLSCVAVPTSKSVNGMMKLKLTSVIMCRLWWIR